MYNWIKSMVSMNGQSSNFINCNVIGWKCISSSILNVYKWSGRFPCKEKRGVGGNTIEVKDPIENDF